MESFRKLWCENLCIFNRVWRSFVFPPLFLFNMHNVENLMWLLAREKILACCRFRKWYARPSFFYGLFKWQLCNLLCDKAKCASSMRQHRQQQQQYNNHDVDLIGDECNAKMSTKTRNMTQQHHLKQLMWWIFGATLLLSRHQYCMCTSAYRNLQNGSTEINLNILLHSPEVCTPL